MLNRTKKNDKITKQSKRSTLKEVTGLRIRVEDKIFVQNFDLKFIFREIRFFPEEISEKVQKDQSPTTIKGVENEYNFDYFFETKEALGWLENQCWLINLAEYQQKTDKEIKKEIKMIRKEVKKLVKDFVKKEDYFRENAISGLSSTLRMQEHIIFSLETVLKNRKIRLFSPPKDA